MIKKGEALHLCSSRIRLDTVIWTSLTEALDAMAQKQAAPLCLPWSLTTELYT